MAFLKEAYLQLKKEISAKQAALIAVSKTKPLAEILQAYDEGQLDFGENYVQELVSKYESLPKDIRWHFIGHLQSNKVKYIAPFVYLIQGVDSEKLLHEINRQASKLQRIIPCLLQIHIASEETKFGFSETELAQIDFEKYPAIEIRGLMGMASFTDDNEKVRQEFRNLHKLFSIFRLQHPQANILSMGMSGDFRIALEEGSNMLRIGSLIFGERSKSEA